MPLCHPFWLLFAFLLGTAGKRENDPALQIQNEELFTPAVCNCTITQSGATYPISALMGTVPAANFYSYGNPNASSANTGLELGNGLILFLYEDINTGIISIFLIADIANDADGGSMQFELSCLPPTATVVVQDDAGEFSGSPPLITGNWSWSSCCTDGGAIENIGCSNTFNLDLLVSSGIDSIVWLTGDIASPMQILLAMTGEAITVNCGGSGVCCPQGFDTGISVTDATCPDSSNGVIEVTPQDGLPPYSYNWSNGATTSTNSGLTPGTYSVTVTDAQGCSEEHQITVNVSPGDPSTTSASIEICSYLAQDYFDLTSVNDVVNLGLGFNVLWFTNPDMTGAINNPSNYLSPSATVYAVVDNGFCLSEPVPVDLILLLTPTANATSLNMCEEDSEMATFDLTTLETTVSDGSGEVQWFSNPLLTIPVADASAFFTGSTVVYAVVFDGTCTSDPVEVELIVDLLPEGFPASMNLCGDEFDEALFDLTLLEMDISGGIGIVSWFLEVELYDPIPFPNAFQTTTTTVYAVVFDGICNSLPIPVDLIVEPTPAANPISIESCSDGSNMAVFTLTDYDFQVGEGTGSVEWFLDEFLSELIPDPDAFLTESTIVFATVNNGLCISEPVQVILTVLESVEGNPASLEICSDSSGMGIFDLTLIENEVTGGLGSVLWFEDAQGNFMITTPTNFISPDTTVYAQVIAGTCVSELVPVTLSVVTAVSANSTGYALCADSTGITNFNLFVLDAIVSGGNGQVNWYLDSLGMLPVPNPGSFSSADTIVYARVIAGSCSSEIVPVMLVTNSTPVAFPLSLEFCVSPDDTLILDLNQFNFQISPGASIDWYSDIAGLQIIPSPAVFVLVADTSVFANASIGNCTSSLVEIQINTTENPTANSISILECGDTNGQVVFDLTSADILVGENTGVVSWYGDPALNSPVPDPVAFLTGDTILYAVTTNGICMSDPVPVTLDVTDSLVAVPLNIEVCLQEQDTALIDLTQYNLNISGGSGSVLWFSDSAGMDTLTNPKSYWTTGDTLYARVVADGCVSDLASIEIAVASSSFPDPSCLFSSIDSLSIDWLAVSDLYELSYTINGQPGGNPFTSASTSFTIGDLGQGDTLILQVTALYDSICIEPLTGIVTCITDVCPAVPLDIQGLKPEYCRDNSYVLLQANPSGGIWTGSGVAGDTLFLTSVPGNLSEIVYSWQDNASGCVYDTAISIIIQDPLNPPELMCQSSGLDSVVFTWSMDNVPVGFQYSVNQGPLSPETMTNNDKLEVDGLLEGDTVTLFLWTVGTLPCGNSDTVSLACVAKVCPPVTIEFVDPGFLCSSDQPIQLDAIVNGSSGASVVTWSGDGIIDPSGVFDPDLGVPGNAQASIEISVEDEGCVYDSQFTLQILETPVAEFLLEGTPCIDSLLKMVFTGNAIGSSDWDWDLDGGTAIPYDFPPSVYFSIQWDKPGTYLVGLTIDYFGCLSEPFQLPVEIDAPLDTPVVYCVEEDFYSVTVAWDPVAGASSYQVSSSEGQVQVIGSTAIITQLNDNSNIEIAVTAVGMTACGASSQSIICHTPEFIPVEIFIPTIFSPNDDGYNDVFFIQSNSEVNKIHAMRIFDRWGNLLFEQFDFLPNDPENGWDGSFRDKPLNPAVYTYWVELETTHGEETLVGDVSIIR